MKECESAEAAYDRQSETTRYWCFIDLAQSTNYRLVHGPREGYVRGETFFSLVRTTLAACSEVSLIKEIGDCVFLCSGSFRPLFETVLLVDLAASLLANIASTTQFPFAVRAGIAFGPAKRLVRGHEDFLGSPIDLLSRIMSVRAEGSTVLLHGDVIKDTAEILKEYEPHVRIGEQSAVSAKESKGALKAVYYRPVLVDRKGLGESRRCFGPWAGR